MAAKIFSPPSAVGSAPVLDPHNVPEYFSDWEQYVQKVSQYALAYALKKSRKLDTTGCIGQELRFPVADGHASYIVLSMRPVELIELPGLDGWQFQFAHLLTAAEIRRLVGQQRKMAALFGVK